MAKRWPPFFAQLIIFNAQINYSPFELLNSNLCYIHVRDEPTFPSSNKDQTSNKGVKKKTKMHVSPKREKFEVLPLTQRSKTNEEMSIEIELLPQKLHVLGHSLIMKV